MRSTREALLEAMDEQFRKQTREIEAIEEQFRKQTREIEAIGWLQKKLDEPIPPTGKWAADAMFLLELIRELEQRRPRLVVDLGSGVSTIVTAMTLRRLGEGRVVAVDHDEGYAEQTRGRLQGFEDVARVVHAPLEDVLIGSTAQPWYGIPDGAIEGPIDVLVVDGPPAGVGPMARYPALLLLRPHLAPGACVLMDDGNRSDEREAVRRWEAAGGTARYLETIKGAWVLAAEA